MAEEQQRLKTSRQIDRDILSLQQEINKLDKESIFNQIQKLQLSEDFKKTIDKTHKNIVGFQKGQINIDKKLIELSKEINAQGEPKVKKTLEAIYAKYENTKKRLKLEEEIANLNLSALNSQLIKEQKIYDVQQRKIKFVQGHLSKLGSVFSYSAKNYDFFKDVIELSGKSLILWSTFTTLLELSFEQFFKLDKAAANFRIKMGLLRKDSEYIHDSAQQIAIDFTDIGVKIEDVYVSAEALSNEFGGTVKVSKDLIENVSVLKAQLGVAEDSTAGFLRNVAAISKSTAQAQVQMSYLASALSSAAGIPLNMVMQDVAKMSGNALSLVSRMPTQIVKTAVAARELGTTLNKMADASRNLINFTESVNAEMEASVLIGKSINLQKARELAYRRDIEGSTREILKIAKQIDFQNLDVFQMEAFANASGRSTDELLKMIQAQKQLQEAKNIVGLKDQVATYERLHAANQATLKDAALQRELTVKQLANQERIAIIQQQWNQLILQATEALFPFIDAFLKILNVVIKIGPALISIGPAFRIITFPVLEFLMLLYKVVPQIQSITGFFAGLIVKVGNFNSIFVKIGEIVMKIFPFLSKFSFAAPFLRAIPIIGWVITGMQFLYDALQRFQKGEPWYQVVFGAAYDVLIKPFVDVVNWIMKWMGGHSPSEIGLSIVRGLVAVEGMIFDSLTSPFRNFLAWIADKIPGFGGIAEKLRGGMTGAMKDFGVLEKTATVTPIVQPATIKPEALQPIKTSATIEKTPEQDKKDNKDSATLIDILKQITVLNNNLVSGKVAVMIDGQLLSSTLSRQTNFIKGYGVNNIQ